VLASGGGEIVTEQYAEGDAGTLGVVLLGAALERAVGELYLRGGRGIVPRTEYGYL
jgi:hypothetical protein